MSDIMKNRYVLPHQAFIDLSGIQQALYRIQAEGDEHSIAIATQTLALVTKIHDQAQKVEERSNVVLDEGTDWVESHGRIYVEAGR